MESNPTQEGSIINAPGVNVGSVLRDSNLPKYYSNGFVMGMGEHDMFILSFVNSNPSFILNLSFSTAKQLLEGLKKTLDQIEGEIGDIKSMPTLKK